MVYRSAEVTLIENSTAGNPPKTIAGQTVEIIYVPDIVKTGVDGKTSRARQLSTVTWFGGTAKDVNAITNVRIIGNDGAVLIEGELNRNFEPPRDVAEGVEFKVLRPE